jgi:hypothetical protein
MLQCLDHKIMVSQAVAFLHIFVRFVDLLIAYQECCLAGFLLFALQIPFLMSFLLIRYK